MNAEAAAILLQAIHEWRLEQERKRQAEAEGEPDFTNMSELYHTDE